MVKRPSLRQLKIASALFGLTALSLVLLFQNCAGQFQAVDPNANGLNFSSSIPFCSDCGGVVNLGTLDPGCFNSSNYDACLYWKNPVAQTNQTFDEGNVYGLFSPAQIYGVKIQGNESGSLKNSAFTVLGTNQSGSDVVTPVNGSWKFPVTDSGGAKLAQVSTYYWLQYFTSLYESLPLVSSLYVRNHNLFVYAHVPQVADSNNNAVVNNNAYFNPPVTLGGPAARLIIGVGLANTPLAFSGEILIHEFSHANLYYASLGAVSTVDSTTYANCFAASRSQVSTEDYQRYENKCCKTKLGCMRAIDEATADFHAAVAFASKPTIGEAYANDVAGIAVCGDFTNIHRNPNANSNLTADSVFNACGTYSNGVPVYMPGEFYTVASVYTSALWEFRKAVQKALPSFMFAGKEVTGNELAELVVYEAASSFDGSDTFVTARAKLKDAANAVRFALQVNLDMGPLIDAEFNRRGLN